MEVKTKQFQKLQFLHGDRIQVKAPLSIETTCPFNKLHEFKGTGTNNLTFCCQKFKEPSK
jgi:hypothetical protein